MSTHDLVTSLAQELEAKQVAISEAERYLSGTQPLAYLSATARDATRLGRMASNLPSVQVTAIAERLRVTGLSLNGSESAALWADFKRNDLDQTLPLAFREALGVGSAYAIVWDRTGQRRPVVSIESATQVVTQRDPGTRETVAAFKRWSAGGATHARLYLPDAIVPMVADGENASAGWRQGAAIANPLGVVPVVEFRNSQRLLGSGVSEIDDLKPLVDALNKLLADLMVGSEFYARPRRWATGVELGTDDEGNAVNPFPEGDRMMIAEDVEARFGSLPAADLQSYEAAVRVILGQIMAVSALPAHYLGAMTGQVPGADGLRAAEAALTARAESKQALFGRPVEQVGRLMHAIRTETDPVNAEVGVKWAEAATRSVAQEADAVVKLHQAGLLPADYALSRLGYDDAEITAIRAARLTEQIDRLALPAGAPA
ncbi:phage portal protein [Nocardioides zeae]